MYIPRHTTLVRRMILFGFYGHLLADINSLTVKCVKHEEQSLLPMNRAIHDDTRSPNGRYINPTAASRRTCGALLAEISGEE